MSNDSFFDDLLNHVDVAFDRRDQLKAARRRRIRRGVGALAAVLVVSGAVLVNSSREPAAAGVRVTRSNGTVTLELVDVEYRPEVIEAAAADAGVDVDVTAVATGPSLVGRFVGSFTDGDMSDVKLVDAEGDSFTGFAVPESWPGRLELQVGEPAGDAPYAVFTNAVSEGEPLACTEIEGASASDAARIVEEAEVTATWQVTDGQSQQTIPASAVSQQPDDVTVRHAFATTASAVVIVMAARDVVTHEPARTPPADC